jgi:RHS repeat-associated protein
MASKRGVERRRFDRLGRLTHQRVEGPGEAAVLERALSWSQDDTLVQVDEREAGRSIRHQFRYDASRRLVGWQRNDADELPFEFDTAGNLVRLRDSVREHDGDRLIRSDDTTYRYDRRLRLAASEQGGSARRMWFDARDRLIRVHTTGDQIVHHQYDVTGRLSETVAEAEDGSATREVFYWEGARLARRVVYDHADDRVLRDERYTYDPESPFRPLLRVLDGGEGADAIQYYTTDQRGAAIRLTDEAGELLWAGRYDPYGRCHEVGDETGTQPLRLSGQVHSEATGLSHHLFRVYDPTLARFVSPDPIGLAGGAHTFAYPGDPNAWSDPLGLSDRPANPWNAFQQDNAGSYSNPSDAATDYNRASSTRGSSPITIPADAQMQVQQKTGYEQIRYRWRDGNQRYEARWHTRTPGAPADQGDTWVVSRRTSGTPTTRSQNHVLSGSTWVTSSDWHAAIAARRNGTATPEQVRILDDGHFPAGGCST